MNQDLYARVGRSMPNPMWGLLVNNETADARVDAVSPSFCSPVMNRMRSAALSALRGMRGQSWLRFLFVGACLAAVVMLVNGSVREQDSAPAVEQDGARAASSTHDRGRPLAHVRR